MQMVNERTVQLVVKEGLDRNRRFARARAMFLRQYVGHYYREEFGVEGDEPVNMIFHVIRCLVPSLVMRNPENTVTTEIAAFKQYAYMLGLALDTVNAKINLRQIIRRALVDSFFAMGIVKTGLAATDSLLEFGDTRVDPGQVFADNVDFDDFAPDPSCKAWEEAAFAGHRSRVPRQLLLDDGECDHDVVTRLPRSVHPDAKRKAAGLSQKGFSSQEMAELQDYVDVIEVWVPGANSTIIIPDPEQFISERYIKIMDYYGPSTGPYRYLTLTQPVPGNPYPVAPVGIWYDLHVLANRLMKKQMERAINQKTVIVANPAAADQAEDMRDAEDSEIIFGDPDSAETFSTGGAEKTTDASLSNCQVWFNYMSGNPDQLAGLASNADTATQATILAGNANVTLEDSRETTYEFASGINTDLGWFLHYDPLMDMPMIVRRNARELPQGLAPGAQVRLTPGQRRGEHYHFTFKIKPKSMTTVDPTILSKRIIEFATNVVPALCQAAMIAMKLMVPFNLQKSITDLADQLELSDYVAEWFNDPEFMRRVQMMMQMGPAPEGKGQSGPVSLGAIRQNGGFAGAVDFSGNPANMQAQELAGVMQRSMKGAMA